jgi:two-component system, LytTR family, response regulator
MTKYNCIIVDDNEQARLKVLSCAKHYPMLNIIGHYANPESALKIVEKEKIDILFLDIEMPKLSGLELREQLMQIPVCVFITAYPEHAVESFQLETLDYLVKPLQPERFAQTVKRIEEFMEVKHKASLFEANYGEDTFFLKNGHEKIKIKTYDVLYIEALKDYTLLVTESKRHCILSGIGNLLKENHFENFVRIHRSYAIQKQFVASVATNSVVLKNNVSLPIGNSFRENLENILK